MNRIKSALVSIFLVFIFSCSSNDSTPTNTPAPNPNTEQIEPVSNFKLNVNGVEKYSGSAIVTRTENTFLVKNVVRYFSFDTAGRLGSFWLDLQLQNQSSLFYSFVPNSSNFFDLNLEAVDEVHKRVKGTYSGYIYADAFNSNSESKYVNGSFDLKYQDIVPAVFGLKNQAKINGHDWVKTKRYTSQEGNLYTYTDYSDDEYKITISYNLTAINSGGVYNFTNNTGTNTVKISKFDSATASFINYNATGTMTITKFENRIVSGNYSFNAVNPSNTADVLQVTDGVFKIRY